MDFQKKIRLFNFYHREFFVLFLYIKFYLNMEQNSLNQCLNEWLEKENYLQLAPMISKSL